MPSKCYEKFTLSGVFGEKHARLKGNGFNLRIESRELNSKPSDVHDFLGLINKLVGFAFKSNMERLKKDYYIHKTGMDEILGPYSFEDAVKECNIWNLYSAKKRYEDPENPVSFAVICKKEEGVDFSEPIEPFKTISDLAGVHLSDLDNINMGK